MIRISCDLCGKDLGAGAEPQFVVQIETYAEYDEHAVTEEDLDRDHLEAVADQIRADEADGLDPEEDAPRSLRFDLCRGCRRRFLEDPLGRGLFRALGFSKN